MKSKSREMALEMSVRKPCHWLAEVIVSMVRRKSLINCDTIEDSTLCSKNSSSVRSFTRPSVLLPPTKCAGRCNKS